MILHNSIWVAQDLSRRNPYTQINCVRLTYGHRNLLNKLNSVESTELAGNKHEQYSGSWQNNVKRGLEVPTNNVESCEDNQPSLRGEVQTLCGSLCPAQDLYTEINGAQDLQVTKCHLQNRLSQSESVDGIAGSNPFQPFGSSFASLRWRRLISFSSAVTTNCPVLSPSLFNNSTDSATWCGTRTSNLFDFALMDLVAITQVLVIRCPTIIYEKKAMAMLDVSDTCKYYVSDTLILLKCKNSEARQCVNTNRASDHNVIETYIMAEQQHTQTHPKFTWRFLALSSIGCNIVHIPANTEREAREQSPAGCVMVFAGRLPVREVRHA